MEQLKERNGSLQQGTLEIGRIIRNMSLVFRYIKMEISMKECGKKIKDMDKEHIGKM